MKVVPYIYTIQWGINHCIDINSTYSLYYYIAGSDLYHYGSRERKKLKNMYHLSGKVEDHHLIPQKFREHPVILKTQYPINSSHNIKMMPNRNYDICENILKHHAHYHYNNYISKYLDSLKPYNVATQQKHLYLFTKGLNIRLDFKNNLPWS